MKREARHLISSQIAFRTKFLQHTNQRRNVPLVFPLGSKVCKRRSSQGKPIAVHQLDL